MRGTATFALIAAILIVGGCGASHLAAGAGSREPTATAATAITTTIPRIPSRATVTASTSPPAPVTANDLATGFFPSGIAFWNASDGIINGMVMGTGGQLVAVLGYTSDGGKDWHTAQDAGYETPGRVAVEGSSLAWATVHACPPGSAQCEDLLLYSPSGGHSWGSPMPSDQQVRGITQASFANSQIGWGVSGSFGAATGYAVIRTALYSTADGGRTWTMLPLPR